MKRVLFVLCLSDPLTEPVLEIPEPVLEIPEDAQESEVMQ